MHFYRERKRFFAFPISSTSHANKHGTRYTEKEMHPPSKTFVIPSLFN